MDGIDSSSFDGTKDSMLLETSVETVGSLDGFEDGVVEWSIE